MIILGIDPGTATTGYGVIKAIQKKKGERRFSCVSFGCIKTEPGTLPGERLKKIHNQLNKLIREYKPNLLAVESVYFFKNLKTAIPVSQAKGVIMLTAAKKGIPVLEIAPLEVKMAIVGYGRASKSQTQKMVKDFLNIKERLHPDDAADALGIAICGALKHNNKRFFS